MFGGASNKYICTAQCEAKRFTVLGKPTATLPGCKSVAVYGHRHGNTCEVQDWHQMSRTSGEHSYSIREVLVQISAQRPIFRLRFTL
jgi:hypothetical protein